MTSFIPYGDFGAAKKSVFKPKSPPDVLWSTPLTKRLINVAGALSPGVLGPGTGEDALLGIAAGAQPGGPMYDMEYRATILGGAAALRAARVGAYAKLGTPSKTLTANVIGSKKLNDAITSYAKLKGKSLKDAALAMRDLVAKQGKGLATAAWGYRGLYLLGNLKALQTARTVAIIGIQFIPVVGQIVGAGMSAHGAISALIAKQTVADMNGYVKSGLAKYAKDKATATRKKAAAKAAQAGREAALTLPPATLPTRSLAPPATPSKLPWIIGGIILLVGGAFFLTRKGASSTTRTRAVA